MKMKNILGLLLFMSMAMGTIAGYAIITEGLSVADAEEACQTTYGTSLASLHSDEDFLLVQSMCDDASDAITMTCQSDSGYQNGWDSTLSVSSTEYFMSGVYSVHSNEKEDRLYKFDWCKPENNVAFESTQSLSLTAYDATWTQDCGDLNDGDAALMGVYSRHDNGHEDRQFQWKCGLLDSTKYTLGDCVSSSGWENTWDGVLNFECENDGVLRSVTSAHNNDVEDRLFKFECCTVQIKSGLCWLGGVSTEACDWDWNDGTDWDYPESTASSVWDGGCDGPNQPYTCLVPEGHTTYGERTAHLHDCNGNSEFYFPICNHPSECEEPKQFVWEELMASDTNKPNAEITTLEVNDATLTLTVEVEADYLANSAADDNGYEYGTTYVIDFEDFNAHSDSIKEPGTCQNRDDVFGSVTDWAEVWNLAETPSELDVGTVDYLAYAPGGDWSVELVTGDLCTIKYSASFTWDELMDCTDSSGSKAYITSTDNENDITLSGTIYVNVVSPFDYAADYGFYRVYQLISQPFQIVISKTVYVLGDVGINLLTMDIIAVYKEGEENTFRLIVLTESAEYLRLSREAEGTSYAYVFDPTDTSNQISSSHFATLEAAETGTDCLGNKDYICTQLWQITASDVQCTTGGIFTD
eukprot:390253_1